MAHGDRALFSDSADYTLSHATTQRSFAHQNRASRSNMSHLLASACPVMQADALRLAAAPVLWVVPSRSNCHWILDKQRLALVVDFEELGFFKEHSARFIN